jgi:hypothetical protein
MKKIILISILVILFSTLSFAQSKTDSIGTAGVYWQKIDLLRGGANVLCEVINDGTGTNYLLVATTSQDTVASRTRYQIKLTAGVSVQFFTNQTYVYVKTNTSSIDYIVRTY